MANKRTNDGVRRWREEVGVTTGRIRARGTLPFDPIYAAKEGCLSKSEQDFYGPKRRFYVERRLASGHWITCDRQFQGNTLEACVKIAGDAEDYRVVVLTLPGLWEVYSTAPAKKPVFYSARAREEWEKKNCVNGQKK